MGVSQFTADRAGNDDMHFIISCCNSFVHALSAVDKLEYVEHPCTECTMA